MQRCRSPGNKNHHVIAPHGRISHGTLLHRLPFANPINLSPPKSSVKSVEKPQQPGGETSGRPHRPATRRFSARPLPRERITSSQIRRCWPAAPMLCRSKWPRMGINRRRDDIRAYIACDSCQTITEMDLTMRPRDPDAPIRVALDGLRCLRCNGHGRRRILGLARLPSR